MWVVQTSQGSVFAKFSVMSLISVRLLWRSLKVVLQLFNNVPITESTIKSKPWLTSHQSSSPRFGWLWAHFYQKLGTKTQKAYLVQWEGCLAHGAYRTQVFLAGEPCRKPVWIKAITVEKEQTRWKPLPTICLRNAWSVRRKYEAFHHAGRNQNSSKALTTQKNVINTTRYQKKRSVRKFS